MFFFGFWFLGLPKILGFEFLEKTPKRLGFRIFGYLQKDWVLYFLKIQKKMVFVVFGETLI